MLIDELIDSSFIQYNYITDVISLHPLIVNTIQKNDPDFVDDCQIYIQNLTRQLSSFTHLKSTEKRTLLSLAEAYYLNGAVHPALLIFHSWNILRKLMPNILYETKVLPS